MPVALPLLDPPRSAPTAASAAPPPAPLTAGPLRDAHNRAIRDLRLSITDRCNFRCTYCLDPDVRFLPRRELLSADELLTLARICVKLGIRKIRLTGGEPTLHPELERLIAGCAALPIDDLALTTNGALATEQSLARWRDLGLRRITFSLDTLREDRFRAITRGRTTVVRVLESIRAAIRVGLRPVRVNAVVVRGINDDEVADLAGLARDLGCEMRFIEFMPLDAGRRWDRAAVVPADEIRDRIEQRWPLAPIGRDDASATALKFRFADVPQGPAGVGLIAPVTRPFCGACSRLRITADGKVRPCLFSRDEWDVRPVLRAAGREENGEQSVESRERDTALATFIRSAVWQKQAGHGISAADFVPPQRTMSAIGG